MWIVKEKLFKGTPCYLLGVLMLIMFGVNIPFSFAKGSDGSTSKISASLRHTPYGVSTLQWSPKTKDLTVTIHLVGLAANSTHPAHIHKGDCDDNGAILYTLNNVVADAAGDAQVSTVIPNVSGGIPANNWYVNVHNGPTLTTTDGMISIACGDVSNPGASKRHVQKVETHLVQTGDANQSVTGFTTLSVKNKTLTVRVFVKDLVPSSVHPAHIHAGSCQSQTPGTIVYMLNNLVSDTKGVATSVTVINNVESIPTTGWYVNVHRSTDLTNQTGFDPIACANV